jgi:hypothetical protein
VLSVRYKLNFIYGSVTSVRMLCFKGLANVNGEAIYFDPLTINYVDVCEGVWIYYYLLSFCAS